MKKLLPLLLIIFTFTAHAQIAETNLPMEDSNTILVSYSISDSAAFKTAGKTLIADGYRIRYSDSNFLTILTEKESPYLYEYDFSMSVSVLDGKILIRGKTFNSSQNFDARYGKGKKIVVWTLGFEKMLNYAKHLKNFLKGSEISYAIINY